MKAIALMLVAASLLARVANAVESPVVAPTAPERYVLIVGNNHSVENGVEDLRFADDDAAHYYELFAHYAQGIELLTVLDDESQRWYPGLSARSVPPTHAALQTALERLFAAMRDAKSAGARRVEFLFVFVGHGSVDAEGRGYVHLADGRLTRAEVFNDIIKRSPADITHLIIDACSAYALVAGRGEQHVATGPGPAASPLETFLGGHDLADYPSVGVLVATSDASETHEWARLRAGVFSHEVRSALTGAADINGDGRLEYSEIAAFVDAASSELAVHGHAPAVFAWPPQRDRRAPLLELDGGHNLRRITVGPTLVGHMALEDAEGERWADFHKPSGVEVTLALPDERLFFLHDDDYETALVPGVARARVDEPLRTRRDSRGRGASDQQLTRDLFAIPYSEAYYRGFLSGHPQLSSVEWGSVLGARPQVAPRAGALPLRIEAGYQIAPFALMSSATEHAGFARAYWPVWSWLSLSGALELGYTRLHGFASRGAARVSLLAGAWLRYAAAAPLLFVGGAEVGYTHLQLAAPRPAADSLVAACRGRIGVGTSLLAPFELTLGVGGTGYIVTIDDRERWRGARELWGAVGMQL